MSTNRIIIGYYKLSQDTEYTQYFETASWHEKIAVRRGVYPIYANVAYGRIDLFAYVPMPGICTESFFVNRVFTSTSIEKNKNVGQSRNYTLTLRDYVIIDLYRAGQIHLAHNTSIVGNSLIVSHGQKYD